jgi:hypothetical protein
VTARTRLSQAAVEERRQGVLRQVVEHGETRIDDLATRFDVSLMTMHRDLDDLAHRHLLRKERGRAIAFPALTMETVTRFRENAAIAAKTALWSTAATAAAPARGIAAAVTKSRLLGAGHCAWRGHRTPGRRAGTAPQPQAPGALGPGNELRANSGSSYGQEHGHGPTACLA